jgi:hypothetical protein
MVAGVVHRLDVTEASGRRCHSVTVQVASVACDDRPAAMVVAGLHLGLHCVGRRARVQPRAADASEGLALD